MFHLKSAGSKRNARKPVGIKKMCIRDRSTTHSQMTEEELLGSGIKPNTIRLSIGTENIDDIIEDLEEAFKAVQ